MIDTGQGKKGRLLVGRQINYPDSSILLLKNDLHAVGAEFQIIKIPFS
jgi:hypothetical protein